MNAKAQQLENLAAEAFQEVKRRHLTGLPAIVSLLVIDRAYQEASRLRRASGIETEGQEPGPRRGRRPKGTAMTKPLLNEFDKDEWREVARKLMPDMSDEEFERYWVIFQAAKARKAMQ